MNTDLTVSIVRILRSDKETTGTGFVIAEGLIVTCAHVIPSASQPDEGRTSEDVELVFRACGRSAHAKVVVEWWRLVDCGDVAFLRLNEPLPAGVSPLPLGSSRGTGNHAFQTFGFPSARSSTIPSSGSGEGFASGCGKIGAFSPGIGRWRRKL